MQRGLDSNLVICPSGSQRRHCEPTGRANAPPQRRPGLVRNCAHGAGTHTPYRSSERQRSWSFFGAHRNNNHRGYGSLRSQGRRCQTLSRPRESPRNDKQRMSACAQSVSFDRLYRKSQWLAPCMMVCVRVSATSGPNPSAIGKSAPQTSRNPSSGSPSSL